MKAFKQINMVREHRIVWSCSVAMILTAVFFVVNPVFAQLGGSDEPEFFLEIQREYDEAGKLVKVDSIKTWHWRGQRLPDLDSGWTEVPDCLDGLFPRNFDDFSSFNPRGPHLHRFWEWDGRDSTVKSVIEEFFDPGILQDLTERFTHLHPYSFRKFSAFDSTAHGLHPFEWYRLDDNESYKQQMDEWDLILKSYQKEHRELIEKHFGNPMQETKP